jgi:hypothetical protein
MRHGCLVAGGRRGRRRCEDDPSSRIDCVPLTATGEALIRLDGDSVSHVDRAPGGKGAFTIDAVWRLPGFAIHSDKATIGPVETNTPLARARVELTKLPVFPEECQSNYEGAVDLNQETEVQPDSPAMKTQNQRMKGQPEDLP